MVGRTIARPKTTTVPTPSSPGRRPGAPRRFSTPTPTSKLAGRPSKNSTASTSQTTAKAPWRPSDGFRDRYETGELPEYHDTHTGRVLSAPGPKTGRCKTSPAAGFNPRPARRPSAAREWAPVVLGWPVSILARPEGRALPCHPPNTGRSRHSFNPRPARRPGAARPETQLHEGRETVSILARPEGRALLVVGVVAGRCGMRVSILARPEGRALLGRDSCWSPDHRSFNPRPARRPGAARPPRRVGSPVEAFQSSPGPKAGRCQTTACS